MSKEEKQKQIITETCEKHFKHFGYKKTSIDDIAKELNISKKTIYKFFSTKEKIYYHVISKIAKGLCKKMEKKISGEKTNKDKIEKLVHQIFSKTKSWLKKGNDAFEFKYKYEISELAFKEAYNELLRKIITKGMENNEFSVNNVSLTLKFINGIFSESMKLVSANPDINIEDDITNSIFKLIL
jgi:AcrR family transcriptional regulator